MSGNDLIKVATVDKCNSGLAQNLAINLMCRIFRRDSIELPNSRNPRPRVEEYLCLATEMFVGSSRAPRFALMGENMRSHCDSTYVGGINKHPLLTRAEETALAEAYRERGDLRAAHTLVVSNLRFVLKVAHQYAGYGMELSDLVQEGNLGLMVAVKKFDPSRGVRLISYAIWWIRAFMQSFIVRTWSLVKTGTTQAQRRLFFKLRSARNDADRAAGPGQTATAAEVAERLEVAEGEVSSMEVRLAGRDLSLDMQFSSDAGQSHLDLLPDRTASHEEQLASLDERRVVRRRVVEALEGLNPKERYVVENRLMTDEPRTLREIGEHFHFSRERARQIESSVIRKIRSNLSGSEVAPLGEALPAHRSPTTGQDRRACT